MYPLHEEEKPKRTATRAVPVCLYACKSKPFYSIEDVHRPPGLADSKHDDKARLSFFHAMWHAMYLRHVPCVPPGISIRISLHIVLKDIHHACGLQIQVSQEFSSSSSQIKIIILVLRIFLLLITQHSSKHSQQKKIC